MITPGLLCPPLNLAREKELWGLRDTQQNC